MRTISIFALLAITGIWIFSCTTAESNNAIPVPILEGEIRGESIYLSWTQLQCDNYRIERSEIIQGNWSEIATRQSNENFYSDDGLTPGQTYFYRVRCYNSSQPPNFGNYSNEIELTIE